MQIYKVKFIYSEKATEFWEIFTLLLTVCTVVKSKVDILQNFVAFSEYMNFTKHFQTCLEVKIDINWVIWHPDKLIESYKKCP